MFTLGLVSVSFRSLSVDEIMHIASDAGLSFIEWGSDIHAPHDDTERLAYIAERQKALGIRTSSYGTYFKLGVHDTNELYSYIRAGKTLGTDVLRIWCGERGYGDMTDAEREHMRACARHAAQIAEEEGAVLCFECHTGTYTDSAEGALDMIECVGSGHLRMYWQPNQWQDVEWNLDYAAKIAPYTVNIHVFDWEGKIRYPLSHGVQTWRKYLSAFDNRGTLLLEFMPDDRPESLASEAQTLREIAGGVGR